MQCSQADKQQQVDSRACTSSHQQGQPSHQQSAIYMSFAKTFAAWCSAAGAPLLPQHGKLAATCAPMECPPFSRICCLVAQLHSECHTPGELRAGLHVQQALNLPQSRPPVHPGYWGQTCNGHLLETGCCQWLRLQRISTGVVGARGVLSSRDASCDRHLALIESSLRSRCKQQYSVIVMRPILCSSTQCTQHDKV